MSKMRRAAGAVQILGLAAGMPVCRERVDEIGDQKFWALGLVGGQIWAKWRNIWVILGKMTGVEKNIEVNAEIFWFDRVGGGRRVAW